MSLFCALVFLAAGPDGVVIRPVAALHAQPAADSAIVSQAILGAPVGFEVEQGGWIKVRTADDYSGWMEVSALRRYQPGDRHYTAAGVVVRVANLFANLYSEPDVTTHPPLMTLPFEAVLEVISEPEKDQRRWIEVRLPDGRISWLQRGDVISDLKPLSVRDAIALAKRLLGLPYLWGGTSTFGYDCSGLTQMLYRQMGVIIPRDAGPQCLWKDFRSVERSALKAGDLLFFGPSADKIVHTGMYIGDGNFVHATVHNNPVVQTSRLNNPHWSTLLVACRRLK